MTKKRTILVIDDSVICGEITQDALFSAGFNVVLASSPLGASRLMRQSGADLVVVDVAMPTISGDKLVHVLQKAARDPVPILLHSDRPLAELRDLAANSGAHGAVEKTADCVPLIRAITDALNTSRR